MLEIYAISRIKSPPSLSARDTMHMTCLRPDHAFYASSLRCTAAPSQECFGTFRRLKTHSPVLESHSCLSAQPEGSSFYARLLTQLSQALTSVRGAQLVELAAESAERDNKRALARKEVIEERKEKAERAALAAEQEEADRRLLQQRINDSVEERRREDEMCAAALNLSSTVLNLCLTSLMSFMSLAWYTPSICMQRKLP